MSYRTSTPPIRTASSENASPLQASKENIKLNSTPKHRKPLGYKNENTTPVSTTPSNNKLDPRIGHRVEKEPIKFTAIRPPEPLHLKARTKKQQQHRQGLRDHKTPLKNQKNTRAPLQDENAAPSASKSTTKTLHSSKHHKSQPSVKVPSPDGSFSIWVDESKHTTEKGARVKKEDLRTVKQKEKAKAAGVDQENVLPSKQASPPAIPLSSSTQTQRVQIDHTERTNKKKWTRKPLTEIDVHDLPEYREILRDGSPTPASHNVSSSSLHSLSWSDGEAVLSQALEQAEATAQSILSEIKGKKDEPIDEEVEKSEKKMMTPSKKIIPVPAEDVFAVATKKSTEKVTITTTTTTTITTTTERKAKQKRRSDETGSSEAIANNEEDSIKKRLRPRRR
ncbi:hypothetical protein K450DRAFT_250876 [Umbelopsis ramanniana AG]|uniref:Uncharacterized protein n=1 Tax=Umbelopsis ramanniana AG TaxID=1314678 RepID=A0AAD5E8L1_UMBRA|nr:uncharacterized protein K450DRAFT_250876 [Umbelopsis ramanniana AG]KAI8577615.1 hypothetical protein K450DRAFT_250876 [Umbelopsis ramanniana AG]